MALSVVIIMKIKDVTLSEISSGINWKVLVDDEFDFDLPLEDWDIEDTAEFERYDTIAYSAVYVVENNATPLILIKEVQGIDYGGDYCEYINGKWRQLGLEPDPNAPVGQEYIANPLDQDPSFDAPDWDHRGWHRENFRKFVIKL